MKKIILLAFFGAIISCSTSNKSSLLIKDEELFITRTYIGDFLDYCYTDPQIIGGHDLIWIKTTVYSSFGDISAYSKTCDFSIGDRIYLKPTSSTPGNFGYWEYQIENDYSVHYRMSEFRFENNIFVRTRSL